MAMHYALIALARGRNEAVPWSLVSQAIKKFEVSRFRTAIYAKDVFSSQ
jgi:hypothetical protein